MKNKNTLLLTTVFMYCFAILCIMACDKPIDEEEDTSPITKQEFTVTFDANEGTLSSLASVKVEKGKQVTKPSDPTRTDYSFVEWRKKGDTTAFNFSDAITSDITLVAAWALDSSNNPIIWMGSKITFTKADGADPSNEANQDRLTDKVWLTRGNNGGQIYNIVTETVFNKANSPLGTEWAFGKISDGINTLDFKKFRDLGQPKTFANRDMVLHLIEEDIYIDLKFTSYSQNKQGGFAYERSTK